MHASLVGVMVTLWCVISRRYVMQLERPPSRQRPPPQALHLWTPLSSVAEQGEQQGLVPNETRGPAAHRRPQSAAPTAGNAVPAAGPHKPQVWTFHSLTSIASYLLRSARPDLFACV